MKLSTVFTQNLQAIKAEGIQAALNPHTNIISFFEDVIKRH
jgi:hypothetical protein